jgi:TolB-like protein/DNA-binding winged helix-turn-helix (wHTH) protein/Tfp pilus assembly protein PilF
MPSRLIRFGEFELDAEKYELLREGHPVKLERLPMELLILFAGSQGTLVTRQVIIEHLWGKDVYRETERGINTAINKLRSALDDDPHQPRYLQTVIGKGYRFIAEVQIDTNNDKPPLLPAPAMAMRATVKSEPDSVHLLVSSEPSILDIGHPDTLAAEPPTTNRIQGPTPLGAAAVTPLPLPAQQTVAGRGARNSNHRIFQLALLAMFVVALGLTLGYFLIRRGGRKVPEKLQSIAVLPLLNLSPNTEQEYLVDGMTDQLITDLARASPLRVISRTSTMQYKGTHKSLPEIAKDLNVDAIVEGSVLPSQNNVRITAQLLDARTDRHLWAQSYERSSQDLLAMQDEVARDIVHEIVATLQPASYVTHEQKVNPEAYDEYLRGRFLWNRRTLGDLEKSIGYYQQAIQLAPDFAPAYVALGNAYAVISIRGGPPPSDTYPRAREAAEKALRLDDSLGEAHALLGQIRVNYDHDWDGGEKEFRQAIKLNPNYATAHHWYAEYLASMKRLQEAQAEIDKAAMLDPLSLIINGTRGEMRYLARDPNSAIKLCLHAQELDPNFGSTYLCLGKAYEQQRQFSEADSSFKRAVGLSGGNPGPLLMQAHAYALSGRKDLASVAIDRFFSSKHGYISYSDVAAVYCAMGQPSQAITWLEKAIVNREEGLNRLAVEPLFDGCRHDSRFQALIQRLGLPQ